MNAEFFCGPTAKKFVVTNVAEIDLDTGAIRFLNEHTPDSAAKAFWFAVSRLAGGDRGGGDVSSLPSHKLTGKYEVRGP